MSELKIAIIGMAGIFPGANNIHELWYNLLNKKTGLKQISYTDLDFSQKKMALENKDYVPYRGQIDDAECFDYKFFGYSKNEAVYMDPQQRKMLQVAWNAFEDAGIVPDYLDDRNIGVYIGASENTYLKILSKYYNNLDWKDDFIINMGNLRDIISTRVSYIFNLHGPSLNVQTACSTSLSALFQAVRAILAGDCEIALVGAAAIRFPQNKGHIYYPGGVYSKDGRCNPFEKNSSGTVSGNGVSAIIIKRLDKALKDKNRIYSIINTIQMNNDGARKAGFTAPSIEGQVELIKRTLINSKIPIDQIGYVEAHGTATPLGDPIEFESLKEAISSLTYKKNFIALGSIKANVGHLDACSGLVGLIKASLQMYYKCIPPHPHFVEPNENIDLTNSPFFINDNTVEYPYQYACVNSLGIGGTNVFAVLEQASQLDILYKKRHKFLFVPFSVHSKSIVQQNNKSISNFISKELVPLDKLSRAMLSKKMQYAYRSGLWIEELENGDRKYLPSSFRVQSKLGKTVFVFPGGGNFYENVLQRLYADFPIIKNYIDECIEAVSFQENRDKLSQFFFYPESINNISEYKESALLNLLITFIINNTIGKLLIHFNVVPDLLIGHSLGEYNCAVFSSALKLEDAIRIIETRADIFQRLNNFIILNVSASEDQIKVLLKNLEFEIIACNSFHNNTIIVPLYYEAKIKNVFQKNMIQYSVLDLKTAAHSSYLDPYLDEFKNIIKEIPLSTPLIPIIGNLEGEDVTEYCPEYFTRHLRQKVEFKKGIESLLKKGVANVIQVGKGTGLLALVQSIMGEEYNFISSLGDMEYAEKTSFLNCLSAIWLSGNDKIKFDFPCLSSDHEQIPLPPYIFKKDLCIPHSLKDDPLIESTLSYQLYSEEVQSYPFSLTLSSKKYPHHQWISLKRLLNMPSEELVKLDEKINVYVDEFDLLNYFSYYIFVNFFSKFSNNISLIPKIIDLYVAYSSKSHFFHDFHPLRACLNIINQENANLTLRLIGYPPASHQFIVDEVHEKLIDSEKVCYVSENEILLPSYRHYKIGDLRRLKDIYNSRSKTIVIAGGMGRVGLHLLKKILEETSDNVVILGRRNINLSNIKKEEFPDLTISNFSVISDIITRYQSRINYISCDISNLENVEDLSLELGRKGIDSIRCFIMSASSSNTESIRKFSWDVAYDDMIEQIKPKDIGLSFACMLTANISIERIVTFSSNASRLGGPGMISYSLANALIDKRILLSAEKRCPLISICFDAFRFTSETSELFQKSENFIDENQLFEIYLGTSNLTKNANIIVSNQEFESRTKIWLNNCKHLFDEQSTARSNLIPIDKKTNLHDVISVFWQDVLGEDTFDDQSHFFNIGGNSLLAFKLLSKINSFYNINFSLFELKKNPTLKEMCDLIKEKKDGGNAAENELCKLQVPDIADFLS